MGPHQISLRRFSKCTVFATLFLIFAGSLVTSTSSGLAVPDWPLSYGSLFPPMVGGVFYEHGHRMIAATVGFMMLVLAIWLAVKESRKWVKVLGFLGLGTVICQGLLGGITVLFFLPTAISISHAVLAQTFFIITILLAYALSFEWKKRFDNPIEYTDQSWLTRRVLFKYAAAFCVIIYVQLILGALMRHTDSGLAIPDFPKIGGRWIPFFGSDLLDKINSLRFDLLLDPVQMNQIVIHFCHRMFAFAVVAGTLLLTLKAFRTAHVPRSVLRLAVFIDLIIFLQIIFGVWTVLSVKSPYVASVHVLLGAFLLGLSVLLALRIFPFEVVLKDPAVYKAAL